MAEVVRSLQPRHAYSARLAALFSTPAYQEACRRVFGPRAGPGQLCTVCHGAPWLEHAMVWREGGVARGALYTGYQHARLCQPAADVAILLYTSTSRQFRAAQLSGLLRGYHRTLTLTLAALGHTDTQLYPFSQFFADYQVPARAPRYSVNCSNAQDAILPAVGVAVTALPGLAAQVRDEVDGGGEVEAAHRLRDIMEDLVQLGIL